MNSVHKQFHNNLGILTNHNFLKIKDANVLIVGLGGLGGQFANNIARLGVHNLTLVDFDRFDVSNLNRQLFSNHLNIGQYKVDVINTELIKINPDIKITVIPKKIEDLNIEQFKHIDYLIDTVDSPKTKIFLSELSTKLNIPLLHGACAGWYGQLGWMLPGCQLLHETYQDKTKGLEEKLLNPSFMPSAVAAVMTSEFVKFIQESKETIINELLLIDLFNNKTLKTGKTNG